MCQRIRDMKTQIGRRSATRTAKNLTAIGTVSFSVGNFGKEAISLENEKSIKWKFRFKTDVKFPQKKTHFDVSFITLKEHIPLPFRFIEREVVFKSSHRL